MRDQDRRYQEAVSLCRLLEDAGHPTMFAGGCVRDRLLGRIPKDYDLATTMLPKACLKFLRKKGFRVIPTGLDHGTVAVATALQQVEITTLRRDAACDGRHAEVVFDADFEADAKRRDFTINALFEDADGRIHDFVGGQADLERKRLRFVGLAEERIREDYLRTLRYFRFLGRYGWPHEPDQIQAIEQNLSGLEALSAERIHAEMNQILLSSHVPELLQLMDRTGVLRTLFPWYQTAATAHIGAVLKAMDPQDLTIAWFTLLFLGGAREMDNLKPELERLRFTRADRKWTLTAFAIFAQPPADPVATLEHLLSQLESQKDKAPALTAWIQHRHQVTGEPPPKHFLELIQGFMTQDPPLIPKDDLMALPPAERGDTVKFVKICWYLGICRAKSDISDIVKKRNTFRQKLRMS